MPILTVNLTKINLMLKKEIIKSRLALNVDLMSVKMLGGKKSKGSAHKSGEVL